MSLASYLYQLSEYLYFPFFGVAMLMRMSTGETNYKNKQPILLLHGKTSNEHQWVQICEWFKEASIGPVYTMNYVQAPDEKYPRLLSTPKELSLVSMADKVYERIQEILENEDFKEIAICGHSMGGIVASLVEQSHPEVISKVVCLGSPFKGSPLAENLDYYSKGFFTSYVNTSLCLQEMLGRKTSLLKNLRDHVHTQESRKKYFCTAGIYDIIVPPSYGAPDKVDLEVDLGHFGFMAPKSYTLWTERIFPFLLEK